MVLKAILQKESLQQSLPKVTSEATVRKCIQDRNFPILESLFNKVAE